MIRIHWITALLSGVALGLIAAAIWLSIVAGPTTESTLPIGAMLTAAIVIAAIAWVFGTIVSRTGSRSRSKR
ncbi:hypothetical protein [Leifsonia sp. PS1209]|uniref:hypothetical protein n=1 Tax=Leifsonia sp. PS1209 TaxID=2724914 RepID=UPI001442B155|nr:hypothetical protein [Leifsonia sp. PS1209]QIZ98983.1 hypothetical protein HF024_11020 [Leifsonia sp. PS1209]